MTWKKLKILGAGSYGKVYLAVPVESTAFSALAAVKSADARDSSALLEEGLFLNELRGHPNIIQCFAHYISSENGEDVYKYAPGGSLHDLIKKNRGPIPESLVASYTFMILKGLSAIHEVNIVHCDIKPGNILVFPSGDHDNNCISQLKTADFGLAMKVSESSENGRTNKSNRGTIFYALPESVIFGLHETGCDTWYSGCTVAEMITGKRIWSSFKDVGDFS